MKRICSTLILASLLSSTLLAEPVATDPDHNAIVPKLENKTNRIQTELTRLMQSYIKISGSSLDILQVTPPHSTEFKTQTALNTTTHEALTSLKNIPSKNGVYQPRSTAEVQELVRFAIAHQYKIRTIGAAHSAKASIFDANNKHQLRLHLEGDLRKIDYIKPDESDSFAIVKSGAGSYLGVNTADPTSNWENSFNYQVNQAGFGVPMLGGISHQTIAGFLQTSSSGGTAKHTIADVIEEIEWVDGRGNIRTAKKGENEFNAVAVSMGLFGIITHVTFKLPKKYLVEGIETNNELKDSLLAKDPEGKYTKLHDALFNNNEYIHINWLPQKYVDRTMEWTGNQQLDTTLPIKPYQHALSTKSMSHLATLGFRIGNLIDEFGHSEELLKIKGEILKLFCNPAEKQDFRDIWYKALPIDDQADVDGEINTLFSELWFPEDQLNLVMQRLEELFKENPKAAGNFIVEIYCAKESPFWLSPAYGHNALRIDLYWWNKNIGDPNTYFGIFWNKLLDIPGARLHWGKYIPLPGQKYGKLAFEENTLYRSYPKFEEWRKLREEMDPDQIFLTDYWRRVFDLK